MKTTVLGLFSNCEEATHAANLLRDSGFKDLKINCKDTPAKADLIQNYFGNLFGTKNHTVEEKSSQSLVTGIFSRNVEKLEMAKKILTEAGALKIYSLDNMSKVESRSKDFLMKIISLHAKSEIHGSPFIKHHSGHDGMTLTT